MNISNHCHLESINFFCYYFHSLKDPHIYEVYTDLVHTATPHNFSPLLPLCIWSNFMYTFDKDTACIAISLIILFCSQIYFNQLKVLISFVFMILAEQKRITWVIKNLSSSVFDIFILFCLYFICILEKNIFVLKMEKKWENV